MKQIERRTITHMKIQINDNESYIINLNDEVTLDELKSLVEKIELLSKPLSLLSKLTLITPKNEKVTVKEKAVKEKAKQRRKGMKWNGRDDVIKALKLHYEGTKEEKFQFAESKKTSWDNIIKAIHGLRRKHDIKPKELGLKKFSVRRRPQKPLVNW